MKNQKHELSQVEVKELRDLLDKVEGYIECLNNHDDYHKGLDKVNEIKDLFGLND